jgi:hypothetical protein
MRKLLFGLCAAAVLGTATPAAARVWVDVGIGPAPVYVAPPPWRWYGPYWRPVYAYAPCRLVRERIRRPNGRWIYREREVCG